MGAPSVIAPRASSYRRPHLWIVAVMVLAVVIALIVHEKIQPGGLPNGVTLSAFEKDIQLQLVATDPGGFDMKGVASVSCVMPNSWVSGQTFTCHAFNSSAVQIGTVTGTVLPTESGYPWNARIRGDWPGSRDRMMWVIMPR